MLRRYLSPDFYFKAFDEVSPELLLKSGIRALILDIDNTLAPYEEADPGERTLAWFSALHEAGIRAAFVSNNNRARVERFNRPLGLPIFPHGKKPLRINMKRAMQAMQATREETAIMGDQIFTDVLAGRRIGIKTILVPPIRDKRDVFTRAKRKLEGPILRYYQKTKTEVSD